MQGNVHLHVLDMGVYVFLVQGCIPLVGLTQWSYWTGRQIERNIVKFPFYIALLLLAEH